MSNEHHRLQKIILLNITDSDINSTQLYGFIINSFPKTI